MDTLRIVERLIRSHFPHTPTSGQWEVVQQLSRFLFDPDPNSAFLLKGYAGTGKTSLVSALIQSAPELNIKTLLMAPTGRAAKVLSGYSHQMAYTIHKKIYTTLIDANGNMISLRAQNKHSYTLFIVDEASMIGVTSAEGYAARHNLLEDLLDYVKEGYHCRLLLIGDTAQLPPVGAVESPALSADYLCSLTNLNLYQYELTEVVRQEQWSGILQNATSLRQRIAQDVATMEPLLPLFHVAGMDDVIRITGDELQEALEQEYGSSSQDDVIFITRSNHRANLYNQEIRNRILFRDQEINAGDYLMVVKNNYYWMGQESQMSFIANGDIVEVMSCRNMQELYGFHFVDITARFIDYPDEPLLDCKVVLETLHSDAPSLSAAESQRLYASVLEDYQDIPVKAERLRRLRNDPYYNALQVKFAYALTCHKTQGGQWPIIFIDQGYLTEDMIDREYLRWLYTAFTRATRRVYLLNFQDKFFDTPSEY